MAQRAATSGKDAQRRSKTPKSKAQQAGSKSPKELRAEKRDALLIRLVASVLLAFLALFLVLGMFGIHAVFLDFLSRMAKGLVGYGYWIMPVAMLYMAWMLFFLHDEPVGGRIAATGLQVLAISALVHTVLCRITFQPGLGMVKSLWVTGTENGSGGVIPGLLSQGLQGLISKVGAVPVLLAGIAALGFWMFRISAAKLIHRRAEKRRELLSELDEPQEEPVHYDTRADLSTLARPMVRPKSIPLQRGNESRRTEDFDLPLGRECGGGTQLTLDDLEDELLGGPKTQKLRKDKKARKESAFDIDIPSGGYTQQVQQLVRQETAQRKQGKYDWIDDSDDRAAGETLPEEFVPVQEEAYEPEDIPEMEERPEELEMPPLSEAALEVMKEQKVSHGEAKMAAAQVAMEIEAKSDAEAQEKPVYQYPPMSMLAEAMESKEDNTEEMRTNVRRLEETLESFGVDSKISNVVRGPAVTRYEMELKPGVKMNKITSLHEDIALSLGVTSVHVAAVPGKSSTIGIEVPNSIVTSVPIKEVLGSKEFQNHKSVLAFAAGKDISGNYIIGDIAKMPHLLIAGTTGSGKSVCMNSIIVSLLYRDSPEQCRLIMIDPKVVELSIYNGVPHLLIPVVTDPKKAAGALQWAVTEMDRRYKRFEDARVRDLAGFNKKAATDPELEPMPRIVVIIDELADLMMVAAKEVETSIARLAAKARAAGMHLVIATQRPSADVITGVIKANIPSRIAFAVSSAMESNIIMGTRGAEKLLGKGDMFYAPQGASKPRRVQGCFISDEEVEKVAEYVKNASETDYSQEILQEIEQNAAGTKSDGDSVQTPLADDDGDELLPEAVEVILDTKQASVSMLQRRLKLGYAHAARIVDEMEEKGIVGPFEGSKPRQLLITKEQWDTMVGINPKAKAPELAQQIPEEDDVPFEEDEEG